MNPPTCHYCPAPSANRDHIVPRARGGRDVPWNIVPSCVACNERKGSDWPTCQCRKCQHAVSMHPKAFRGEITGASVKHRPLSIEPIETTRCPDCGDPTMSPFKCPWCRNTGIQPASDTPTPHYTSPIPAID
jgi:hypothetical protein